MEIALNLDNDFVQSAISFAGLVLSGIAIKTGF